MKKLFILLVLVLVACSDDEISHISSFYDIPGITPYEIVEIEALLANREYLVYGMLLSDETFHDIDGNISGFAVRISEWMSGFFGIPVIPVIVEWHELMAGLENGNIDLTSQLASTPLREITHIMTDPIVMRPLSYTLNPTEGLDLPPAPLLALFESEYTVGVLEQFNIFDGLQMVFVETLADAEDLLLNGYADAFFGDGSIGLTLINDELVSNTVQPYIFKQTPIMARQSELAPIINAIQLFISNSGIRDIGAIYAEGLIDFNRFAFKTSIGLAERAFIETDTEINVGVLAFNYPIGFYSQQNSQFEGAAIDVLKEIEQLSDLRFNFIDITDSALDIRDEVDMIVSVNYVLEGMEDFILSNTSIFSSNYALISHVDEMGINVNEVLYKNVGLVANSAYEYLFNSYFPNHQYITRFGNMRELLEALVYEEVDMAFSSSGWLLYLSNFTGNPNFWANVVFNETQDAYFGFLNDNVVIANLINEALLLVDTQNISNRWNARTFDYRTIILTAQMPWLLSAGVLFVGVLVLLTMLFLKRNSEKEQLVELVAERTNSLEFEKNLLTTILDSMPDVLFCRDLDFRYHRINKAFTDLFNVANEDVIGKTDEEALGEVLTKHTLEGWRNLDLAVLQAGSAIVREEVVVSIEGVAQTFETTEAPIMDQTGNITGFIGITRDITPRKLAEDAIIKASRAKSDFISNMSHEIRTPMNSIIGFSELALEDVSPKTQIYINRIIENAKWLLQIINDILDISKIESGKMELEKIPFSLREVFAQCNAMVSYRAAEKGINLFFDIANLGDERLLLGDPMRLRQIIVNLLSNSVKFTNVGMIKLTAYAKESSYNHVKIYFEVQDSGIGMTEDQVSRIFEPFMQADTSITRKYGGTGLGLPISQQLIEAMGGSLSVDSILNLGSKFSFTLPFSIADQLDREITLEKDGIKQPLFEGDILVCEDNEMNQLIIEEHLSRLGLNTIIAKNGLIAVNEVKERMRINKKPFELIFMDIHMPVMDGLEASEKIMAINSSMSIVAITANVMTTDKAMYAEAGIVDCLGKPFTSQELWACLLKHLTPIK
ncbi:MAG: ATP-binding protein [Turicibacter sp.]|nr:ATP-binding protein [Turicibacter sp.]